MSTTVTVPKFWVMHYRCGHVYGILVADQRPQRVVATEEHAWKDFHRGHKKRAARRRAEGCYVTESETVPDMASGPHDVQACLSARVAS